MSAHAVQDTQEQETDLLLPNTSSTEGVLPLVNSGQVLPVDVGEALHRSEDCTMFSISAKAWHGVFYHVHVSSQPVENHLTTSHVQSGNLVCTEVTAVVFELTRVRVMQVSSVLYF